MSIMSAVATPLKCEGIPSHRAAHVSIDDEFVAYKEYSCVMGHNFEVAFQSPYNLPVFWECGEHEVISYES